MKPSFALAPLLLCAVTPAFAATPIQLSHAATPTVRVTLANVSGTVAVSTWDRPAVAVTGTLGDGARPLAITGSNGDLAIKVTPLSGGWFDWGGSRHMGPTTLDVRVPRGASLDVQVVSAPLSVDGIDGGTIKVNSVSGRVRINARTPALDVDSVSGTVAIAGLASRASVQTVSGDILLPVIGPQGKLQTVSGSIQAGGGPWRSLALSTVSGNAQITGSLAAGGTLTVDSMSGNVQLQLPANTSAMLHASTFSGGLRSDFGETRDGGAGSGHTLEARLGSGSGTIKLEAFSGDVRIRKAD